MRDYFFKAAQPYSGFYWIRAETSAEAMAKLSEALHFASEYFEPIEVIRIFTKSDFGDKEMRQRKFLTGLQGYIIAKMQEGYGLRRTKYEHKGYISSLHRPQGGYARNVSNRVIDALIRRGFVVRGAYQPSEMDTYYVLTEKGLNQ